jgi:hypothetical protein
MYNFKIGEKPPAGFIPNDKIASSYTYISHAKQQPFEMSLRNEVGHLLLDTLRDDINKVSENRMLSDNTEKRAALNHIASICQKLETILRYDDKELFINSIASFDVTTFVYKTRNSKKKLLKVNNVSKIAKEAREILRAFKYEVLKPDLFELVRLCGENPEEVLKKWYGKTSDINSKVPLYFSKHNTKNLNYASVLILAGPSGAGKSTLSDYLLKKYKNKLVYPMRVTTRPSWAQDDKVHIDKKAFMEDFRKGKIELVYREYGCLYGTYIKDIEEAATQEAS